MNRRHMSEALLRAMREELERRTLEEAERIFGTTASGPRPSFKERDFGRWSGKVGASPSRSDFSSFKESFGDESVIFGGTPCESFAKPGARSLFLSRAYLAVSEEPGVAVAAVRFRAAKETERRLFWKVGADGMRVYANEWFERDGPGELKRAEAFLRRRIRRALIDTTPSAEPSLW